VQSQMDTSIEKPQLLLHRLITVATAEATQSKLVLGTCPDGHAPQPHN
jgi:hypothetical protein